MHHARKLFVGSQFTAKRASLALSLAVCSALSLNGTNAAAQSTTSGSSAFGDWVARSTIVVAGSDYNSALYATPKGALYDGVATLLIQRTDGYFFCSGALLAGGLNVLTAAHCLSNSAGTTLGVAVIFFPPGEPNSTQEIIVASSATINPAYTGQMIDAHDIAIVTLSSAPSLGILNSAYSLYMGDPFGQTARAVGSGGTGTGATGQTADGGLALADRRTGLNTIDFTWTDPQFNGLFTNGTLGSADPYGLIADFDSGLAANDASCNLTSYFLFNFATPICDLGQGESEVNLGLGDSGGPLFINNQIAGVASYGLTFTSFGDTDGVPNSSFSEFSGWTSTAYNADWINQVNTTVPEPRSFVLVGAGLFALVGAARRRHRVS